MPNHRILANTHKEGEHHPMTNLWLVKCSITKIYQVSAAKAFNLP